MSREQRITQFLQREFSPDHLSVENESSAHSVPVGSETHFKVMMVSTALNGLNRVQRQQRVYACLQEELKSGLHALSLKLLTPEEWQKQDAQEFQSPPCAKK